MLPTSQSHLKTAGDSTCRSDGFFLPVTQLSSNIMPLHLDKKPHTSNFRLHMCMKDTHASLHLWPISECVTCRDPTNSLHSTAPRWNWRRVQDRDHIIFTLLHVSASLPSSSARFWGYPHHLSFLHGLGFGTALFVAAPFKAHHAHATMWIALGNSGSGNKQTAQIIAWQ